LKQLTSKPSSLSRVPCLEGTAMVFLAAGRLYRNQEQQSAAALVEYF
jgi:hypothetical protein